MTFNDFGFKKFINDALTELKFVTPIPIQQKTIPLLKRYQSVVGQSHTGTGKTHAFLLPLINNLKLDDVKKVQVIIITPTRELARQTYLATKQILDQQSDFSCALFIGGDDIQKQMDGLQLRQPNVVIGTPTRIRELYERNALNATSAWHIVVDECDMIFDLGFIDDLDFLLSKMAQSAKVSVFSATMNVQIKQFLKKYLRNAYFVEAVGDKPSNKNIEHILIWTKNRENKEVLQSIVNHINPFVAIIFVNKKDQVPKLKKWLSEFGIRDIGELHGDLNPRQRANMQKRIAAKEFKWLVASDLAARGIDIDGVSHIISIDLPNDLDYYIHRSGRTGRSNYTGQSYVLFNSNNQFQIDKLKSLGIHFTNMKLQAGQLVPIVEKKRRKATEPSKTDIEVKRVVGQFKNKEVKPGYKKKRKMAVEKVKKTIRREHIKESIKKIKKARYQQRREDYFD